MIDDRLKQFYRFYKIKDLIDIRDKYYGFMKEAERSFDSFKDHEFCKDGLTEFYPDLSYEDYAEMVVFMADLICEKKMKYLYFNNFGFWDSSVDESYSLREEIYRYIKSDRWVSYEKLKALYGDNRAFEGCIDSLIEDDWISVKGSPDKYWWKLLKDK